MSMRRSGRRILVAAGAVLAVAGMAVSPSGPPASGATAASTLTISTLANRADLISGPSTLVQVNLPAGTTLNHVSIALNGQPVDNQFAVRPNGQVQALLTGLHPDQNIVSATLQGNVGAQLVITDHPIGGPVISGPQTQPWFCNN